MAAQEAWAATAPRERSEILRRAYEIILDRREELALLMTLEMGKPLAEARGEVRLRGRVLPLVLRGGRTHRRRAHPDPRRSQPCPGDASARRSLPADHAVELSLVMGTRKIGPAIAAGCTMVLKPAPQTPLSSLALAGILAEAGLPAGARLVDVGRGALVDEEALGRHLADGRLAGAALDVFGQEPLPAASPLWDLPGVIVSPHTAGEVTGRRADLADLFLDNLRRRTEGRPPRNVIDKRKGYVLDSPAAEHQLSRS